MQNGLVLQLHVVDKNQEGCLDYISPPEEQEVPAPQKAPQPKVPVPGRKVPITIGCKVKTKNKKQKKPSGQDEGVDRYTLPPRTTKRRTTNLKTKITRIVRKLNCMEV